MDDGKEIFNYYENSGYKYDRNNVKTLYLRWHSNPSDSKNINIKLSEPLKIDVLSDIYLDNFTTFHTSPSTSISGASDLAFILNINEFNVRTNVAGDINPDNRNRIFNNIVIPSDALSNNSGTNVIKSHKSKKMNYICNINPVTITNITGDITNLDGDPIFGSNSDDMFMAEFILVARK